MDRSHSDSKSIKHYADAKGGSKRLVWPVCFSNQKEEEASDGGRDGGKTWTHRSNLQHPAELRVHKDRRKPAENLRTDKNVLEEKSAPRCPPRCPVEEGRAH